MFTYAYAFDQPLGDWNVSNVGDMYRMFSGIKLSMENYDHLLLSWAQLPLQRGVHFDGGKSICSETAFSARQYIIDKFDWTIRDGHGLSLIKHLHSTITKIPWNVDHFSYWNGSAYERISILEFKIKTKIANNDTEEISMSHTIHLNYSGDPLPPHDISKSSEPTPPYYSFEPGFTTIQYQLILVFIEDEIDLPLAGIYTFWVSDPFEEYIDFSTKAIRIYDSALLNFVIYDYVFFILGLVGIGILTGAGFVLNKRVHKRRLSSIIAQKLKEVEKTVNNAQFSDAITALKEVESDLKLLNNPDINLLWRNLHNHCVINQDLDRRIQEILDSDEPFRAKRESVIDLELYPFS